MLNSPESKRQYPKRLQTFFNFLKLQGDIKDQSLSFVKQYKNKTMMVKSLKDNYLDLQIIKKKE